MTFTDDDLRRLKSTSTFSWHVGWQEIKALLARLEAAEDCVGYLDSLAVFDTTMEVLLKSWRKSKGASE